jgi:peptidoglycan/xylan/chitin deacetylase (PgdA/CDA1 family)
MGAPVFAAEPGSFFADGPKDKKVVALTFDDGPSNHTDMILAVLKNEGIKATFFMEGDQLQYHPAAGKAVMAAGHEIGSHLYSHPDFWHFPAPSQLKDAGTAGTSDKAKQIDVLRSTLWNKEAEKTDAVFMKVLGFKPLLLRMPFGYAKPWVREEAKKRGYILINWTYGADWTKQPPEELASGYIKRIKPGAIFLMHDGWKKEERSVFALEALVKELKSRGYGFVTISELLELK